MVSFHSFHQTTRLLGGAASSLIIHLGGAIVSGVAVVMRGGELIDHLRLFGVPVRHTEGSRVVATALLIAGGYLMAR